MAADQRFNSRYFFNGADVPDGVMALRFCDSNYLRLYKDVPKPPELTAEQVAKAMPSEHATEYMSLPGSVSEKAIIQWSMESVYRTVNKAIIADNAVALKSWMPWIRACNYFIVHQGRPDREYVAYRGSKFSHKIFDMVSVGDVVRLNMFVAMDLDREKAETFKNQYIVTFKVPKDCWNAAPVWDYSVFASPPTSEKEILMPPYSPILITGKTGDEVFAEVLDGANISEETKKALGDTSVASALEQAERVDATPCSVM